MAGYFKERQLFESAMIRLARYLAVHWGKQHVRCKSFIFCKKVIVFDYY